MDAGSDAKKLTLYSPREGIGLGVGVWWRMLRQLWDSRELTWRLFMREFSARYRQSVLGYAWALLSVGFTVATLTWLNRARLLPIAETELPYPLFLLLNTTVWYLFASGLQSTSQSLVASGNLIAKINFPRETLVLSAFAQAIFDFVLRLVLLVIGFFALGYRPSAMILLLPLLMIPLALWTLALGLFFSLANVVFRDVAQVLGFVLPFFMLLSPVVYPVSPGGDTRLFLLLNPVAHYLIAAQDLAIRGTISQPTSLLVVSAIGAVLFCLALRIFQVTGPRIAERL